MEDDLFGDLLGPKPGVHASSKASTMVQPISKSGDNHVRTNGDSEEAGVSVEGPGVHAGEGSRTVPLSHSELSAVIDKCVQSALESTFAKFVRSLKTVLEDVARRISAQEATTVELRAAITELRNVVAEQPSEFHIRFSNLDMAVKEVERGVQALRDRQELQEAQQLLAMMSSEASRGKAQSANAAVRALPGTASAQGEPEAASPAAPAGAPAPSVAASAAPAPAPAATPAAMPATAIAAAPGPNAVLAAPPGPSSLVSPSPGVLQMAPPPPQQPASSAPVQPQSFAPQQPQQLQQLQQLQQPQSQSPLPGYGAPLHMGLPGAPPLPMPQAAEQQQQHMPPQQQPLQQAPMGAAPYPYQAQPAPHQQLGGSMPSPPGPGPEALSAQYMPAQTAPALMYPPYGATQQPPPVDPLRPPSVSLAQQQQQQPQQQPQQQHQQHLHQPHGGAPPIGGMGSPLPQVVNYPAPPAVQAYPPPPAVPVPSMYGRSQAPPAGYRPSAGSAPMQPTGSGGGAAGPSTAARTVPLDKIVSDISQMGFGRADVLAAVHSLQASGKALDLNTIIDKLTRG